ncbi:MAG TPA: hypothetical protein PK230_07775 [Chitinophagales bacterium]|nr:hypothetical protein [Chitinophagales bacterium]
MGNGGSAVVAPLIGVGSGAAEGCYGNGTVATSIGRIVGGNFCYINA